MRQTATDVRARNAALDHTIRTLASQVRADRLAFRPEGDGWTLAENLGHLAEFPSFFANQVSVQIRADRPTVGRTHEHVARQEAISRAAALSLEQLRNEVDVSLAELGRVLESLHDEHLPKLAQNRRYGLEPLATFLDRYVLGHKAAHIVQLEETLRSVGSSR